ncbi:hypothetical protein [Erythrobacter sp.]|uniref:hypothetical protein n=1 Tax=Erythrobacter sp. TaxID=1042 RepID=UPI0014260044|nr:hypothetical protein [Erythrobacter sp.]QIQ86368.1 MAG: hypothetical protein G9473_06490 [Erythrobacter sp.]
MPPTDHPPVLCAATIVREDANSNAPFDIRAIALFTARRHGEDELQFELDHKAFGRGLPRKHILAGLAHRIPAGATLIIRGSAPGSHDLREALTAGTDGEADLGFIARQTNRVAIQVIDCPDEQIENLANRLDLRLPRQGALLAERCRHAPAEAQALWANFVCAFCEIQEARTLIAAFQAWHAIEKARPLPF